MKIHAPPSPHKVLKLQEPRSFLTVIAVQQFVLFAGGINAEGSRAGDLRTRAHLMVHAYIHKLTHACSLRTFMCAYQHMQYTLTRLCILLSFFFSYSFFFLIHFDRLNSEKQQGRVFGDARRAASFP